MQDLEKKELETVAKAGSIWLAQDADIECGEQDRRPGAVISLKSMTAAW